MKQLQTFIHLFLDSFTPLKDRNIGVYMSGQAISLVGTWMQITAQAWVVWQLTHTATALGIVALLSQLPFFVLGPIAGVWADRLDRRKILIITQIISMILAFILAGLIQFHAVQLWHVYLLAVCLGIVSALDMPSQQAFIADISKQEYMRKTVTINISFVQLSRMVGPAFAGWVIATLGVAAAFWINGISFLAVILSLSIIHSTKQVKNNHQKGIITDFKEGALFIARSKVAIGLIIIMSLMTFFGWSIVQILPAVSGQILHGNAGTLGLLMGASGAGALCGSLFVVPFAQKFSRPAQFIIACMVISGLSYALLSFATTLSVAITFQFLASMLGSSAFTTSNGIMQLITPIVLRARVLSLLLMITLGLQPIASFLVGLTADIIGISNMIFINGTCIVLGTLILFYFGRTIREYTVLIDNQETAYEKFSASPMIEE